MNNQIYFKPNGIIRMPERAFKIMDSDGELVPDNSYYRNLARLGDGALSKKRPKKAVNKND